MIRNGFLLNKKKEYLWLFQETVLRFIFDMVEILAVLRAAFPLISLRQKSLNLQSKYRKAARRTLVKLTLGGNFGFLQNLLLERSGRDSDLHLDDFVRPEETRRRHRAKYSQRIQRAGRAHRFQEPYCRFEGK